MLAHYTDPANQPIALPQVSPAADLDQMAAAEQSLGSASAPIASPTSGLGADFLHAISVNPYTPPTSDPGVLERAAGYTATAIPRAISGITEAAGNIAGAVTGQDYGQAGGFLDERANPPPSTSTAGKVTDVIGQSFAPAALQMAGIGGVVGKLANIANLTSFPLAVNIAKGAAEFGTLGAESNAQTGGEQTLEGGALGALTGLSRVTRLPFALALGALSKAYFDRNGSQPVVGGLSQGDLSGLMDVGAAMLPGMVGEAKLPIAKPTIPTVDSPFLLGDKPATPALGYGDWQQSTARPVDVNYSGPGMMGPDNVVYGAGPSAPPDLQALQNRPDPYLLARSAEPRPPDVSTLLGQAPPSALSHIDFQTGDEVAASSSPSEQEQQATDLAKFRQNRVIYAKDTPLEPATGAPITVNQGAIVATDAQPLNQRLFTPEQNAVFKQYGITTTSPEFQTALQRLQFAMISNEALGNINARKAVFTQFLEDARDKTVTPSDREPLTQAPNPSPEGGTIPVKGKVPDLPEYMRTQGGGVDPDTLAYLGLGATKVAVGAGIGAAVSPDDRTKGAIIGGALGLGAHLAPTLIEALQDFKARRGSFLGDEVGAIGKGAEPLQAMAKDAGSEYQGKDTLGLHAFKELSTGGNFSLRDANLTPENVAAKAEGVRQAFAKPQVSVEEALQRMQGSQKTPQGLRPNAGWKLHLGVDPEDREAVNQYLSKTGLSFKQGFNAGQEGKDFTIYVGSKNAAVKAAQDIHSNIGDKINPPKGEVLNDDTKLAGNVMGRFDAAGDNDFHQYGKNGIPLLNSDVQNRMYGGDFNEQQALKNSDTILKNKYGSFYSGSEENLQGMQKAKGASSGGYAIPEVSQALTRAAIGSFVGGISGGLTDGPNDHSGFITGAIIGAGAGIFMPSIARTMTKLLGESKITPPSGKSVEANWGAVARNWNTILADKAGSVLRGSATISDRFALFLDKEFKLTRPEVLDQILAGAKGQVSVLLDQMQENLKRISIRFNPTDEVNGLTNKLLDGELTAAQYKAALDPHVTTDPNVGPYRDYAVAARTAIDGLQRITADNLNNPKMAAIIRDSIGQYVSRSYKLFNNPAWRPTQEAVDALAKQIYDKQVWKSVDNVTGVTSYASREAINTYLNQYIREVKTTKGLLAAAGTPEGQQIGQALLKKRIEMTKEWKDFLGEITDPRQRIINTVARLRPMAETAKYFGDISKADIDGMPASFASFGDKDAYQAKVLQQLQNPAMPTLAADYAAGNHANLRTTMLNAGMDSHLVGKLAELDAYQLVENHPKFGALAGDLVHRNVWDTLKTFDSTTDMMNHPLLRSIANSNTMVKLLHTAYNPLTAIRNIVTLPAFMTIARVDPMNIPDAWRIMQDVNHPLRNEIIRQGISGVDQIKGELFKEWQKNAGPGSDWSTVDGSKLGMGKYDLSTLQKYASKVNTSILDAYRIPDNLTRIAAYLSAKARIADTLGKALDDPEVINKATEFTNRYTLNYDNVAPAIKNLRQVPLVNLFISFHAEVARLAKNLVQDVIQGDQGNVAHHSRMAAIVPLALSAAVPDMLQSNSEAQLSDKDRADWEKAKGLLPDYSQYRYRWVTGRDSKTGQFNYVDFTPLVHTDLLNQMAKAIRDGNWKSLAAINPVAGWENTPALNILISQATGADLQTKRDFRFGAEGVQDRLSSIAKEILPPWTPSVGSEAQRLQQAYTSNSEGGEGLTSTKTGIGTTPGQFWSSYVGALAGEGSPVPGGRAGSINLQSLQKRVEDEGKSAVANEMAYANDILKSNADKPTKDREIEKTKLALANIVESYRAKLGLPPLNTSEPNNVIASQRQ